jgi:hypothetical protein
MFPDHRLPLTATGIVLGVVAAVVVTRVLSALLFGVARRIRSRLPPSQ